jgi:hypothetical protein
MDAQGVIRYLGSGGATGRATTVPGATASSRSVFSVSPDDRRIAVAVIDFSAGSASTRLYVENLNGGGSHIDTFSEGGAFTLWPVGWHGAGNLVVAKVPACTEGRGPGCCGPLELHVVDPATADRKFTLGGPGCLIAGAPSPAGAVCVDTGYTRATVLDWAGTTVNSFGLPRPGVPTSAYLSPLGGEVALVDDTGTTIFNSPLRPWPGQSVCGWIDPSHLLAGGDTQQQPRVIDAQRAAITPVAALGGCAGRIPGGL